MSERNDYPPGVPCWVDTLPPDPEAATRFYGNLMGWTFTGPGTMPGDSPGRYFVAQFRGRDVAGIGSRPPGNPPPPVVWNTYICVASADDAAKKVADAGGRCCRSPSTFLPRAASRSSPIRTAPYSARGSPGSAWAHSSSTSPAVGR